MAYDAHLLAREALKQVRKRVFESTQFGNLSAWITKNTTLKGRPYSFKGYEYLKEIIDSAHYDSVAIKPSQTGNTEGITRFSLAFPATTEYVNVIYALPTLPRMRKMVKSRQIPVIKGSPVLKAMLDLAVDSLDFKQLGSSQIFNIGTYGGEAISDPADMVVVDEYDFCDQEVVATLESRLSASRFVSPITGLPGIRRRFSTPTVEGFGVDALFEASNKMFRLVKCAGCGHWFWPNLLEHAHIPQWNRPIREFTYRDLQVYEDENLVDHIRLLCPGCKKPISQSNFAPEHREWVAERPDRKTIEGFRISPFDAHLINTPVTLFRKLATYKDHVQHWHNFALGMAYTSGENSVQDAVVQECAVLNPITPEEAGRTSLYGLVAGMDVGKICRLLVGVPVEDKLHVVWAEEFRAVGGTEEFREWVKLRLKQFGVRVFVPDAMPYTPDMDAIRKAMPPGFVFPHYYGLKDTKLEAYKISEKEGSVTTHRTRVIDSMVQNVNAGRILWPTLPVMKTVRAQLQGMKRIDPEDEGVDELSPQWHTTGEDHFFHAAVYLNLAWRILSETASASWFPPPMLGTV